MFIILINLTSILVRNYYEHLHPSLNIYQYLDYYHLDIFDEYETGQTRFSPNSDTTANPAALISTNRTIF